MKTIYLHFLKISAWLRNLCTLFNIIKKHDKVSAFIFDLVIECAQHVKLLSISNTVQSSFHAVKTFNNI